MEQPLALGIWDLTLSEMQWVVTACVIGVGVAVDGCNFIHVVNSAALQVPTSEETHIAKFSPDQVDKILGPRFEKLEKRADDLETAKKQGTALRYLLNLVSGLSAELGGALFA